MGPELFSDVILTRNVPERGLCAGDVGTVVERHARADGAVGYSVEFFDLTGGTVAVVVLPSEAVRGPRASDRLSSRTVTTL